jgi:hypothetical protein
MTQPEDGAKGAAMKIGRWAGLLAAATLLAGCGDFWQAPSGGGGTTSTCTAAPTPSTTITAPTSSSGNFYILNNISATQFQVVGYSIASGTLTPLTSPAALTGQAYAMAIDPNNGHFLFVSSSSGIFLYTIGSGGTLSLQSNTAVVSDAAAYAIQVDPSGQWLLDASNIGPALSAYPINSSTGVSTLASGVSVPSVNLLSGGSVNLGGIAVSSDNKLVAVAMGSAGTQTFTFTAGNGNTGSTSPFGSTAYTTRPVGSSAISVAFGPQTSYLYIGETAVFTCSTNSGGLRIIPISSDVPGNEPSASPYPSGGTSPHAILPLSTGYVYVANWEGTSAGNITGFLVASGPTLTVQSNTVATGTEPYSMTKDSTGNFVLAVSSLGSPTFDAYTFDTTTTGQLDTAITSSSTGTGPMAIVATP